ncbi:MAG: glycoside hydrolase 43 family protein [Tannerellaceae bacterium]|nr:glycoside hydrolase 43 family protein [Tannerellaceae bacterium]
MLILLSGTGRLQAQKAHNPVIWADVPDMSMIRVGDTYYMSSTTMHMNPGVPIMKSKNLVDWEIASYAYETLGTLDAYELQNGQDAYGGGTWASSLRYHNGTYYVSTFSNNSRKNYIFSTKDPEKTPWEMTTFEPMVHDHSLFFDDDGKTYIISCGGNVGIREMKQDLSGIKDTENKIVIQDADAITGKERMLPAEGAQMFKVNGKYYLFLITWPKNSMRTVLVYRASHIMGPYEGRVVLEDKGIAQGGFIDTPDGKWYGYFFGDRGAVGRIPYIVPMRWEDEWPVFGENGVVPDVLDIIARQPAVPAIVASDEFTRNPSDRDLPLVWQWNHNPDNKYWSVSERPGYLRLKTFRLDNSFPTAKNTLTQRTFGPECSGEIAIDISAMKEGDYAGLGLLQQKYGVVGVKKEAGRFYIFSGNAQSSDARNENYEEQESVPVQVGKVWLRAEADFRDQTDIATFYYSIDGTDWKEIGSPLKMEYTLSHFMGYRFALFNYATKQTGGYVDFDYFRVAASQTVR